MDEEVRTSIRLQQLFYTVEFPIENLVAPEYNPRLHSPEKLEALKNSMREDPDFLRVRPIIVNTYEGREGVVIGGSKRLLAAQEMRMETIPVIFVYVPPTKEKAWNVKDNVPTGDWIPEKRKEVLMDLRNDGFDLTTLGLAGGEMVDMMGGLNLDDNPKQDPEYNGTTPASASKDLQCPACGHIAKKKEFVLTYVKVPNTL